MLTRTRMIAAAAGLGCALTASAERFTVVALPDTQNYSEFFPWIYNAQTQWIVDNREAYDIRFVTHLGDIVNSGGSTFEWVNAKAAMDILHAADVPYGLALGNHDTQDSNDSFQNPPSDPNFDPIGDNYLYYFGPQHFQDKPWYGGFSPSGLSNYQIIDGGDNEFLFIHLEVDSRQPELDWAQTVLDANTDKPTVITTHRYVYDYRVMAGRFNPFIYTYINPLYMEESVGAHEMWETFIAPNRQIFAVLCGHVDAEFYETKTNNFGLPVYEILADFQSASPNGGNGWMRLMEFDTVAETIQVSTYSPVAGGGSFRTVDHQVASMNDILESYTDDFASELDDLLDGLDQEDIDAAIGFLFSVPGALDIIVAGLEVQDPTTVTLFAGLLGIDPEEFTGFLDEFPWEDLNRDFLGVAGQIGDELLPPFFAGDIDAFLAPLNANDDELLKAAFLEDPRRATEFVLDVPFHSYVATLPPCAGDVSGDGVRNSDDLNALLAVFGAEAGGSADIDGDDDVDNADLNLLLSQFGQAC